MPRRNSVPSPIYKQNGLNAAGNCTGSAMGSLMSLIEWIGEPAESRESSARPGRPMIWPSPYGRTLSNARYFPTGNLSTGRDRFRPRQMNGDGSRDHRALSMPTRSPLSYPNRSALLQDERVGGIARSRGFRGHADRSPPSQPRASVRSAASPAAPFVDTRVGWLGTPRRSF